MLEDFIPLLSLQDTEKTYEEFPIIEALVGNTDIKPKCNMSASTVVSEMILIFSTFGNLRY